MNRTSVMARVCGAGLASLLVALLAGCGGGNSSDATISGTVTGMNTGNSVVLADNGGDNITVSSNTGFTFPKTIGSTASYNVTVVTQPTGQSCSITYGSGVVSYAGTDISNVAIVCTNDATVGAEVNGLSASSSVTLLLTLQNDTSTTYQLVVSSDGTNTFNTTAGTPVLVPLGGLYSVSVLSQPVSQVCTADVPASASGGIINSSPVTVDFTCK